MFLSKVLTSRYKRLNAQYGTMDTGNRPDHVLTPSLIGQYIGLDSCPRYFRYRTTDADLRHERNWWSDESVGIFLSEVGTNFEAEQFSALVEDAAQVVGLPQNETEFDFDFDNVWATVDDDGLTDKERQQRKQELWEGANKSLLEDLVEATAKRAPEEGPTVLYQLPIRGRIGYWDVSGLSDILLLYPTASDGTVRSLLLEAKSSWSEKSSHQIQAAIYSLLLDNVVADFGVDHEAAAAIIHREQNLTEIDFSVIDDLNTFDLESRITEVRRLLREDGELHTVYQREFEEVGFRLDQKCDGCQFNEICFTKAVESKDPALLGLTQGDRDRLTDHGIDTIDEFGDLYEREEDKRPYEFDGLPVAEGNEAVVQSLSEQGTLGNRLAELVQRAQLLSGHLDPAYDEFDFIESLKGSGNGKLPEDSPRGNVNPPYPEKGLIRVYLYVQNDYVRDRLALLGARISGHDIESKTVVELATELPMAEEESRDAERQLLKSFFERLFTELQQAVNETQYPDGHPTGEAYYHLYFYTSNERDALVDAVRCHPSISGSGTIRDLLGLREGLDQRMVSVIHDEITERFALQYPGTGLIQTVEQMMTEGWRVDEGYHDLTVWRNEQWTVPIDDKKINLRDIFRTGLFERMKPYREQDDSIKLMLGGSRNKDPDGFYPVRNRFGSQIPLEYIWGVCGELSAFLNEDIDRTIATQQRVEMDEDPAADLELDSQVLPYLYRNHRVSASDRQRITRADVEALCGQLCYAVEHIERSIRFKNTFLGKESLPVDLPSFRISDTPLDEACQEYISLERATDEQNYLDHYMNTPQDRARSGESAILRVTDIETESTAFGTKYHIEAELPYDEFFINPDRVLDSCKISGGEGTSGSWLVMSRLEYRDDGKLEQRDINRPAHIRQSANVIIESFDRNSRQIVLTADEDPEFHPDERFLTWHRGLTTPAEYANKSNQLWWSPLEEGALFIVDPYADSWPAERAYDALDYADKNYLYSLFEKAYDRGEQAQFDVDFCDPTAVEAFLDQCENELEIAPTGKQREFIEHARPAISVLQGPPGTGKTSYTLAPAILSRLYAFEMGAAGNQHDEYEALTGGVTAPSHTAVDEATCKVHARLREYQDVSGTDELEDVELFRVGGNGDDMPDAVTHIDYYNRSDVRRVRKALTEADKNTEDAAHVLLFATPTSMRGLVDKIVKQGYAQVDGAEEFMAAGESIYQFLVADEASMLDLPGAILVGSFLESGGQALLIGDHRQMEPVQVHEWESEDRRTIEENVPFMSTLNFVRFLRGDLSELEFTDQTSPEIGDAIPMTGLDRTYRMHNLLADILTELVYQDDSIQLKSDQTETLDTVQSSTPGVDKVMNPDAPVVLLIHDEDTSQDANLTEIAIIEALMSALPQEDVDADQVGVVTPHNAQTGRLQDRLGERITANTVEKFQGGQRDAIFVSATASDPDYVRAESDFLLNPNRLNVAMSRMKEKLVIIASESVFRVIPSDASEYDKAIIWKRLYDQMGVLDTLETDAQYQLSDFLPEDIDPPDTATDASVAVYALTESD